MSQTDEIVKQLVALQPLRISNNDEYYRQEKALEEKFLKINGINQYRHDRQRNVPDFYAIDYTSFLLDYYGDSSDTKYVMKLSPEIVKIVLNDYYNNGYIFVIDVMIIYMGGWEESALKDSNPRSEIWDRILSYMDDNNIVEEEKDEDVF